MGTGEVELLRDTSFHRVGSLFHSDCRGEVLSAENVAVRELIAWGLDVYPHRRITRQEELEEHIERAQQRLVERQCHDDCSALLEDETENIKHLLPQHGLRPDLHEEFQGLDWTLGVVDLRRLLAFQRRLIFSANENGSPVPQRDNWSQLIPLAFGSRRETKHLVVSHTNRIDGLDVSLYTTNPDLKLQLKPLFGENDSLPLSLYGGSPFFEVAAFRGRWFLRDGYHRAYRLLKAGVDRFPAVVIYARTLGEVGATEPWFFNEDQLFSNLPPRVIDFLDDCMVLQYERAAFQKVIRIRIEESMQTIDGTDEG